jgi:predicted ribosomally synthesized peptide with SipW-like signal peptide
VCGSSYRPAFPIPEIYFRKHSAVTNSPPNFITGLLHTALSGIPDRAVPSKELAMIMKLKVVALLLVLAGTVLNAGTLAVFTDTAPSNNNTFTTGGLDLVLSDDDETGLDSVSASVTFSGMVPGDSVTDRLAPTNAGSVPLRYAIASSATNADAKGLKDQLVLISRASMRPHRASATTSMAPSSTWVT